MTDYRDYSIANKEKEDPPKLGTASENKASFFKDWV